MLFITTRTTVNRHGVFGEFAQPPTFIQAIQTGVTGVVGQFPWGPAQVVTKNTDPADRSMMFAPPGSDRTKSGWLAIVKRGWPDLRVLRVLGDDATTATKNLPDVVPTDIVKVDVKYPGDMGNSITWEVSAASDADANHFNLTVSISGASGSTTEVFENINFSGVGADSTFDLSTSRLVGAITKLAAGRPINATGTFAGGDDGTINAAAYVGTAGTSDKGIALYENENDVEIIFGDDCGDTLRDAVNAGFYAHAEAQTRRLCVIAGDSGQTEAEAQTDAVQYQSIFVVYVDPWHYMIDDTDSTERLVPGAATAASVMAQLSPSTSPAWKAVEVGGFIGQAVSRLETNRGDGAGRNTLKGIMTMIPWETGGFRFEAGVNTAAPAAPTKKRITRTRMALYMARSIKGSIGESVDAPNVPANQQDVLSASEVFVDGLVLNKARDPNHNPHLIAGVVEDPAGSNTSADLAAGDFTVPISAQTSAGMERIFLRFNIGENVTVTGVS